MLEIDPLELVWFDKKLENFSLSASVKYTLYLLKLYTLRECTYDTFLERRYLLTAIEILLFIFSSSYIFDEAEEGEA